MELDTTQLFYGADLDVPMSYWENMALKDKTEFIQLRDSFHQNQKTSVKDRRLVSFSNEMQMVLNFTEKNDTYRENKCILIGVAFAGPFICVNTRQLKTFLGRCKSSINGSFQQLGYVALRTKSKARNCVLSVLPSLSNESNLLRQWSVRCASEDAKFCYISKCMPAHLPEITAEDLFDERKTQQPQQQSSMLHVPQKIIPTATSMQNIAQQLSRYNSEKRLPPKVNSAPFPKQASSMYNNTKAKIDDSLDFDLPTVSELGLGDFNQKVEMTPSFSVGNFDEIDDDIDYSSTYTEDWRSKWNDFLNVPRSRSAALFDDIEDAI